MGESRERKSGGSAGRIGFEGASSSDQGGGDVQIRDSVVSVTASNGRFGSDFKLAVAKGLSAHFVFLEDAHFKWLEGVLKVARDNMWFFPRGCLLESERRRIVVARFRAKGLPILRISECCANQKVFFVDVPSDDSFGDWSSLLRFVTQVKGAGRLRGALHAGRTFAEVVGSSGIPTKGRCSFEVVDGEHRVSVSDEGLAERLSFLDRCLVLRFTGEEAVVWPDFRRWILKSWGIPSESEILPLGDGLWMLVCSSTQVVNRTLALNIVFFGKIEIKMDAWIKMAGRSSVLIESEVAWVSIRGIPLHLRSNDLVKSLGEACGVFLEAAEGSDLSSPRVKVKLRGSIPSTISVVSGAECFSVCVELEAGALIPRHDEFRRGKQIRRAKGKEVLSSGREGRSTAVFCRGEASGEKLSEEFSSRLELIVTADKTEERGLWKKAEVIRREDRNSIDGWVVCDKKKISGAESCFRRILFWGFKAQSKALIWGDGLSQLCPSFEPPDAFDDNSALTPNSCFSETSSPPREGLVDVPIRFPTSAELLEMGWTSPRAASVAALCAVQEAISSDQGLEVGIPSGADERMLCEAVRRVSRAIGLETDGSTDKGAEAAASLWLGKWTTPCRTRRFGKWSKDVQVRKPQVPMDFLWPFTKGTGSV
ncbi:hypothetical protein LINPERHAP2_LOCUS21503 [Linum perenne]